MKSSGPGNFDSNFYQAGPFSKSWIWNYIVPKAMFIYFEIFKEHFVNSWSKITLEFHTRFKYFEGKQRFSVVKVLRLIQNIQISSASGSDKKAAVLAIQANFAKIILITFISPDKELLNFCNLYQIFRVILKLYIYKIYIKFLSFIKRHFTQLRF